MLDEILSPKGVPKKKDGYAEKSDPGVLYKKISVSKARQYRCSIILYERPDNQRFFGFLPWAPEGGRRFFLFISGGGVSASAGRWIVSC